MLKNQKIRRLLAYCDLAVIIIYILFALFKGNIPFYTDWINIGNNINLFFESNLDSFWVKFIYFSAYSTFVLYFSFIFSIWGYFRNVKWIKWLALCQLPLRLITQTETIPFFLTINQLIFSALPLWWNIGIICLLFGILELLKVVYLFKQ